MADQLLALSQHFCIQAGQREGGGLFVAPLLGVTTAQRAQAEDPRCPGIRMPLLWGLEGTAADPMGSAPGAATEPIQPLSSVDVVLKSG